MAFYVRYGVKQVIQFHVIVCLSTFIIFFLTV